jgi:hypothetical protein
VPELVPELVPAPARAFAGAGAGSQSALPAACLACAFHRFAEWLARV